MWLPDIFFSLFHNFHNSMYPSSKLWFCSVEIWYVIFVCGLCKCCAAFCKGFYQFLAKAADIVATAFMYTTRYIFVLPENIFTTYYVYLYKYFLYIFTDIASTVNAMWSHTIFRFMVLWKIIDGFPDVILDSRVERLKKKGYPLQQQQKTNLILTFKWSTPPSHPSQSLPIPQMLHLSQTSQTPSWGNWEKRKHVWKPETWKNEGMAWKPKCWGRGKIPDIAVAPSTNCFTFSKAKCSFENKYSFEKYSLEKKKTVWKNAGWTNTVWKYTI